MAKDSSTSSSEPAANRSFPKAALLALLGIAASEAAFVASTDPLTGVPWLAPKVDDAALMIKRELLAQTDGAIVLAGDSSCMMGLKPSVIEDMFKVPTVNLGTLSSHTTHGFADMIALACAKPVKPKLIVLALLPQSLELTEARAREFGLLSRYLVAYDRHDDTFSVTPRERFDAFTHKHEFNVFPPEFGGSLAQYRKDLLDHRGWYPEKKTYTGKDYVRTAFAPTDFSSQGVTMAIEVARLNSVPLVFWWSPYPQDAVAPEYVKSIGMWTSQLQSNQLQVRMPRSTVPTWLPSQFGSVTHLNPAAAVENSKELAAAIKDNLK